MGGGWGMGGISEVVKRGCGEEMGKMRDSKLR